MTTPDLPVLSYAATPAPSRRGKGFLAVCATILFPGIGHWIAGSNVRGACFFLAAVLNSSLIVAGLLLPHFLPLLLFAIPAGVVISLWAYVDAYLAGRRSTRSLLRWPPMRYLAGIGLLMLAHFEVNAPAAYIRNNWVEAYVFTSSSMIPMLRQGDRILVVKGRLPKRWDLVAFYPPSQRGGIPYVFRAAGLPGESVEITGSGLKINGELLAPPQYVGPYLPYIGNLPLMVPPSRLVACNGQPIHLAGDEFFVLGDNSRFAADSRLWKVPIPGHQPGALSVDHIIGVATTIYWPPRRWRELAK